MYHFKTRESAIAARNAMIDGEKKLKELFSSAGCYEDSTKNSLAQSIFRDFLDEYLVSIGIVKKPKLVGANKNRDKPVSRIEFTIDGRTYSGSSWFL